MCSTTIAAVCLLLTLVPASASAEITIQPSDLESQPDTTQTISSGQTSEKTSENISAANNSNTPLNTYQQALNYLLGRNGVEKSAEKAASLFKSLAEQNWSSAQHMLGNMYLRGKGVEKNDLLAYKWLSLASKSNMQLAKAIHTKRQQLYRNLQNNLSLQSLDKVETWIAEWKPSSSSAQLN